MIWLAVVLAAPLFPNPLVLAYVVVIATAVDGLVMVIRERRKREEK